MSVCVHSILDSPQDIDLSPYAGRGLPTVRCQPDELARDRVALLDVEDNRTILTLSRNEAEQVKDFLKSLRAMEGLYSAEIVDDFVERFVKGLRGGSQMKQLESDDLAVLPAKTWPAPPLKKTSEYESSRRIVDNIMEEPCSSSCWEMPDSLGTRGNIRSTGGSLSLNAINQAFALLEFHSLTVSAVVLNSFSWGDMRLWGGDICKHYSPSVVSGRGVFGRCLNSDVYVRNPPEGLGKSSSLVWCLALPDERFPRGLVSSVEILI